MALNRKLIRQQVKDIRDATYCKVCGSQPIEWHHPDHAARPSRRIGALATHASLDTIIDEIMRCTPLCSKCHKKEHALPRSAHRGTYWITTTT